MAFLSNIERQNVAIRYEADLRAQRGPASRHRYENAQPLAAVAPSTLAADSVASTAGARLGIVALSISGSLAREAQPAAPVKSGSTVGSAEGALSRDGDPLADGLFFHLVASAASPLVDEMPPAPDAQAGGLVANAEGGLSNERPDAADLSDLPGALVGQDGTLLRRGPRGYESRFLFGGKRERAGQ